MLHCLLSAMPEGNTETLLNILLPDPGPEEKGTLALLDPAGAWELALCWLLIESLSLLESYLHGFEEFGRRAMVASRFRRHLFSRRRLSVLRAADDVLAYNLLGQAPASYDPAAQVAEVWARLSQGLLTAELSPSAQAVTLSLRGATRHQPHLEETTREISNLFAGFPQEVKAFGYHGSIGSNDHIRGLSDCDAIVILRPGVARDAERLRRLHPVFIKARRMMKRIDRFQHHGIFVLPEELWGCYPEDYFPTVLYETTVFDIGGGTPASLKVVSSRWLELLRILRFSRYLEEVAPKMGRLHYHTFHLVLQIVQLLPCFVVACSERSMNKRDAIPWLCERCSPRSKGFLERTGTMRGDWPSIWSSSRLALGLFDRPNPRKLRERIIEYFGGREVLATSLVSVAHDCRAIAMNHFRSPRNGA